MDPQHPGKEAGPAGTLQEEVRGLQQRKDRTQGGREGAGPDSAPPPTDPLPQAGVFWRALASPRLLHLILSLQISHTCLLPFPRPSASGSEGASGQ